MLSNVQIQFEQPNKLEKTGYSKPSDSILDATKLESLGWKAFFDIKTGLEHTIKYKR